MDTFSWAIISVYILYLLINACFHSLLCNIYSIHVNSSYRRNGTTAEQKRRTKQRMTLKITETLDTVTHSYCVSPDVCITVGIIFIYIRLQVYTTYTPLSNNEKNNHHTHSLIIANVPHSPASSSSMCVL